jgi:Xaa-Pro aminopeptidase
VGIAEIVLARLLLAGMSAFQAAPAAPAAPAASAAPRAAEVYSQPPGELSTDAAQRRLALAAKLGGPSVVWLDSQSSNEIEDRFFQEDNFYYLTGLEQADVSLALRIDEEGHLQDEVLFLPEHDANWEVWNGPRLSPGADAEKATGLRRTALLKERSAVLAEWAPTVLHAKAAPDGVALPEGCKVDGSKLDDALAALRLRKSDYEIGCLKAAILSTCRGLSEVMPRVKPGIWEYEAQSVIDGCFIRLGCERQGFPSIIGSGPNSCALHYEKNNRQMQDGDLVVMDVGAKYRYYSADVTRTVPVNGHFTPRQREVYTLVLKAQTTAFEAAKPGVTMRQLDAIARKVIADGGFGDADATKRGIVVDPRFGPDRAYFKHGLGHWIGLDVHDVGGRAPIEPGMCFTIEPGIYIDEEHLGVRIEDDYLMTPDGAVKLSAAVTSDPDAIEKLMHG